MKLTVGMAFASTGTSVAQEDVDRTFMAISMMDINPRAEHVINALKQGMSGKFAKYGKELSTYDICVWIRKYMETNPPYVDVDDWFFRTRGQSIEEICEEKGFDVKQTREHQTKLFNEKFKR